MPAATVDDVTAPLLRSGVSLFSKASVIRFTTNPFAASRFSLRANLLCTLSVTPPSPEGEKPWFFQKCRYTSPGSVNPRVSAIVAIAASRYDKVGPCGRLGVRLRFLDLTGDDDPPRPLAPGRDGLRHEGLDLVEDGEGLECLGDRVDRLADLVGDDLPDLRLVEDLVGLLLLFVLFG